jgi:hypothetical protein
MAYGLSPHQETQACILCRLEVFKVPLYLISTLYTHTNTDSKFME